MERLTGAGTISFPTRLDRIKGSLRPAIAYIEQFVDEAAFRVAQGLPKDVPPGSIHQDQLHGDVLHCIALAKRVIGGSFIALRRNNIAHLHRPWRATQNKTANSYIIEIIS